MPEVEEEEARFMTNRRSALYCAINTRGVVGAPEASGARAGGGAVCAGDAEAAGGRLKTF